VGAAGIWKAVVASMIEIEAAFSGVISDQN